MSFFSKQHTKNTDLLTASSDNIFNTLKIEFKDKAFFYEDLFISNKNKQTSISLLMMHQDIGLIIFTHFNHSYDMLKGISASLASDTQTDKAEIQVKSEKDILIKRFHDLGTSQVPSIYSILICDNLLETEFDNLDSSFHEYIPKELTLFKDATNYSDKLLTLNTANEVYSLKEIKRSLLPELLVPQNKELLSLEQENVLMTKIKGQLLIKALPGSGKSSILVLKALYEKLKDPSLKLIIFSPKACNVHLIQSLIFQAIENSNWDINPADINVSSFNSLKKRSREKNRFDFIVCDDVNQTDLPYLNTILSKDGVLLCSSSYFIEAFNTIELTHSYTMTPALCAACEGLKVERIKDSLNFQVGNVFMNATLIAAKLLKEVPVEDIVILSYNKEISLQLQTQLNDYISVPTYLSDDSDRDKGLIIYPFSQLSCVQADYIIILVDENSDYDPIELISRAKKTSFILSESEEIYNVISRIKETINEEAF